MSAAGAEQLQIRDVESFYGTTYPPEFFPESSRIRLIECLERARAGEVSEVECPVFDTNGNEVWYHSTFRPDHDDKGQVEYVIATSVEITERKRAEEALRESEERYLSLSEANFEGILIHDQGAIIDVNTRFQEMFGYSLEELKELNAFDLVAPEDRENVRKIVAKGQEEPHETVGLRKDSTTFPMEVQARPMLYRAPRAWEEETR